MSMLIINHIVKPTYFHLIENVKDENINFVYKTLLVNRIMSMTMNNYF